MCLVGDGIEKTFSAKLNGTIAEGYVEGDKGFAYDKIFTLPDGVVLSEAPEGLKEEIGSRRGAFELVLDFFLIYFILKIKAVLFFRLKK